MFPLKTFVSEHRAANLLAQIRWRDGVYCPRCRAKSAIRYGSYRVFQWYLCKNCGRTFNDKTGTVFEYSSVPLRKWYLAVYTYIRLNTSIRQLDAELAVSYKTVYRRVQRFLRALDAPRPQLDGPVEIDELYVSAGEKGRERGRARVACPRAVAERIRRTSHQCSYWLTAAVEKRTFTRRSRRRIDDSTPARRPPAGVADCLHRRLSSVRPTRRGRRLQPAVRRPR